MKGATMWVGVSCVTNFLDSIHCCGGGDSLPACCAQASERFSLFSGGSLAASASAFPLSPSYSVTLLIIPIPSLFSHRKKGRKEGRSKKDGKMPPHHAPPRGRTEAHLRLSPPRIRTSRGRESMSFWHDAISRVRRSKAYLIASLMSLLVKASLHAKRVLKVAMTCI